MTKQTPNELAGTDFVLKHRIAGAAFLLFFGALFLPWLLGDPSAASKPEQVDVEAGNAAASAIRAVESQQVEDELLAAIERKEAAEPEQVYISKITPLGSNNTALSSSPPAEKPAEAATKTPQSKAVPATKPATTRAEEPKSIGAGRAAEPIASKAAETTPATTDTVPATVQANNSIEVGWAVQVGVFTDKNGAARVVKDLQAKGFEPQTTIVDTNRGKATGTRIWLGPFAQRVDAAKAKTRLTNQTGEAGFIRAYP
ncbi:MAG: hypothetical protein HKN85_03430 [Gammaproteobacteria bacterium]|nr:hypothetical protein [Gammaproteobacteria bacterium]